MNNMAYSAAHEVDISILVVDASLPYGPGDDYITEHLDIKNTPLIIVFNKIDQARLDKTENLKSIYREKFPKAHFIDTVASERFNIDLLLKTIENLLPEGPEYYPVETYTDKDEVFQIKEIIREKVLKTLRDEVPHAIAVYMDDIDWESNPLHVKATIVVEKESQKGIVIGAQGKMIKLIGSKARKDIEILMHKHVYLELFVKVSEDWRNQEKELKMYGYKNEK